MDIIIIDIDDQWEFNMAIEQMVSDKVINKVIDLRANMDTLT